MKNKVIAGVVIVLAVALASSLLRYCKSRDAVELAPVLKENEREKVIVDTRSGTVKRLVRVNRNGQGAGGGQGGSSAGTEISTDLSGVRKIAVTVDNEGNVQVYAPTKGVIFEPGLTAFYSEDRFHLGLDAQLLYWRRWGMNVGFGTTIAKPYSVKAYVAGSFNFYSNTSIFAGITQSKEFGVGLRVRF